MTSSALSLVDVAHRHCITVWAVFVDLDPKAALRRSRFWRWLKPGFRHVEIWKFIPPGAWIRLDTAIEHIDIEVGIAPPWLAQRHLNPTCVPVQRTVSNKYFREPFFMGPVTCVELSKAVLGVRNFFVRTPYQLYRFLRKEQHGSKSQNG